MCTHSRHFNLCFSGKPRLVDLHLDFQSLSISVVSILTGGARTLYILSDVIRPGLQTLPLSSSLSVHHLHIHVQTTVICSY